jgi:hypothetical protein
MASQRRKRAVVTKNGRTVVAPPEPSASYNSASDFLTRAFGTAARELIHNAIAARSRVKRLTRRVVGHVEGRDVLFAEHPVHSTIEAVEAMDKLLAPLGEWKFAKLRRAAAAYKRATDLNAHFPPEWVFEVERTFAEIRS